MIRKTGLIRTMAEAQALYASEIKRVKELVNRYLPDPRVFDISVSSRRLPDGLMVFKPVVTRRTVRPSLPKHLLKSSLMWAGSTSMNNSRIWTLNFG